MLSDSMRRWKDAADVSSSFSSYSVRPRLEASVGESSYSSFRNVSMSEVNDDGTSASFEGPNIGPTRLRENGLEMTA